MIFDDFENATLFLTVFTEVGQDYYGEQRCKMLSSICCWHVSMVVPVSYLISTGNLNQCNGFLKKVTTCTAGI